MGYPNIIQQVNSKLPLSGGTMTGNLAISSMYCNKMSSSTTWGVGTTWNDAPSISLYGPNETSSSIPNCFTIRAGANKYSLTGKPDGTLTWGGNAIITSAGGTFAGAIECASNKYSETASNGEMTLSNYAINLRNSDIIGVNGLYFNDAANSYEEGINFPDGTNLYSTILATGGILYFTPKRTFATTGTKERVVTIAAQSTGATGYRKYADGFRIQWGRLNVNECVKTTVTLPIAFSNTNYHVDVCNASGKTVGDTEGVMTVCEYATTNFKISTGYINPNTSAAVWFACGY